ncbi:MAG: T9SS type A sorting domain-containing protein [Marinilabiliaceae bacterium]|nr:T9SS type A sorting domain-containing protein [Marinilabiliaceae bacterium]
MKKNVLFTITIWLLGITLMAQTETQPLGSGSQNDPYSIATWENLYWLSKNSDAWDKYFEQTADIQFPADIENWDEGKGWLPIGMEGTPFTGLYNGNNYSVINIYLNRGEDYSSGMGFFGCIENSSIKNLKLNNVNILGYETVGGLVGSSFNSIIENAQVTGSVKGRESVGGLAGNASGFIKKSFTNTHVSGSDNWYASNIGGFVGSNRSIITECFSSGTVEGRKGVGGFIGLIIRFWDDEGKIENCFSFANVNIYDSGEWYGGFVGDMESGVIKNCYSVGCVVCANGNNPNNVGFVGNITTTGEKFEMNGNYWDMQTSMQTSTQGSTENGSSLPIGKTTAEMKNANTFNGWDFIANWHIDTEINNGYPYLRFAAISMPFGSGTEQNPYVISSLGNLQWFAEQTNLFVGKYFVQTQNIDATSTRNWNNGEGWKPKAVFMGHYDGNGYSIDGLFMDADISTGLFDNVQDATLKNIGLTNVDFSGISFSGGLVGSIENSIIDNCFVTGSINGNNEVGGLIGRNGLNMTVKNSYANCDVSGDDFIGGFIGRNDGNNNTSVTNSFSTGSVYGNSFVGGFVGSNYNQSVIQDCYSRSSVTVTPDAEKFAAFAGRNENATIFKCYATGFVDYDNDVTVYSKGFVGSCVTGSNYYMSNNYWDTETSLQVSNIADDNAANGLTSQQMKSQDNFQGWDFVNTWIIDSEINDGYPSLIKKNIETSLSNSVIDDLISVYPNPFSSVINIGQLHGASNIEMYNIMGNKVLDVSVVGCLSNKIRTNNLKCGIYFLKIKYINKQSITVKILKKEFEN